MSRIKTNERAGAASTATDPETTKALRPAPSSNAIYQLSPDVKSSDDAAPDGADLFNRVHEFASRFICFPSRETSIAHVLWIAHTHLMDAWFSTPRLAVLSPEPGSGKSRVLEITALLVPRPLLSVQSSAAYILRKTANEEDKPTILCDEIDAIFGPNARGNEDLRAMFNAGYRRGATIGRCYTDKGKVLTHELAIYGAVALGGLGDLPETIMSRSIVINMRKRAHGETVEPFRPQQHEPEGNMLQDELEAWAVSVLEEARIREPAIPDGINDRDADVWSPLLVVAELAGGSWPDLAREIAHDFVQKAKSAGQRSLGAQLLADIQSCFGEENALSTKVLLEHLLADDEAPWGDIRGKRMDPRSLGKMLRQYGIRSEGLRMGKLTLKGYKRASFHDAWQRYSPGAEATETCGTSATDHKALRRLGEKDVPIASASRSCGGRKRDVAEANAA